LVDFVLDRQDAKIELAGLFERMLHFDPLMNCTLPIVWASAMAGCTVALSGAAPIRSSARTSPALMPHGERCYGIVSGLVGLLKRPPVTAGGAMQQPVAQCNNGSFRSSPEVVAA
jgi:hypothetical protein